MILGYELIFKITNGIEKLLNLREIEIEILWWEKTGLFIDKKALKKYDGTDIYYVYVIKYGEYAKVPVKIIRSNDNYSIVENYNHTELNALGITRNYILSIYDQIIINK